MLDWLRAYLETFRAAVRELADGRPQVDGAQERRLWERMTAFLPNDRLTFFVDLSADPVARELAGV